MRAAAVYRLGARRPDRQKIDGKYGLVSAYTKFQMCALQSADRHQLQELFSIPQIWPTWTQGLAKVVFKFIDTLVFNAVRNLVPRPDS